MDGRYGASEKQAIPEEFNEDFLNRFTKITSPWAANLEQAKAHNDTYKIIIEEAKVSAVNEIREYMDRIF